MKRVLIVDDDRWFAELLAKQLRGISIDVQIVAHALEAMAAIDEHPPAVIILDIFMPGPNGLVLLQELQSHSDLAQLFQHASIAETLTIPEQFPIIYQVSPTVFAVNPVSLHLATAYTTE